ncbi:hypothetical protein BDF19DRAFT_422249 [Syncephalis fuscata]|nr:hypothetical protein BDF19DRAFT_422249 [Syncephalis fuscata]
MQFEELPAETQRLLLTLDTHIRAQLRAADLFDPVPVIDDALRVQKIAKELQHTVASVDTGLTRDESLIDAVKRDVHRSFRAAEKGARSYEAFKQPSQTNIQGFANITHDYFLELAAQMESRADQYQQEVEKIERHVTLTVREPTTSPQALTDVIRHQHAGLMSQAARVARLHDEVVRIRARYKDWRRRHYGDERDPFSKRQRRVHGFATSQQDDKDNDMNKSQLRSIAESTTPMAGGFGATANRAPTTTGFGGIGFGATPATSVAPTGFGTTAATTGFGTGSFGAKGFGTTATSTAAPTGGFGAIATSAPTSAPATGFGTGGFGTGGFSTGTSAATTPAKPTFGFGATGTTTATSTATSTGFGGFGGFGAAGTAATPTPAATGWGATSQDATKRLFGGN